MNKISWPQLIECLKQVPELAGEVNKGVCGVLEHLLFTKYQANYYRTKLADTDLLLEQWLSSMWQDWPDFSRDIYYPIPSDDVFLNAEECFCYHIRNNSLWWQDQSKYRLSLVDFLLEKANEQVKLA